jgi:membrane protein DedA with SNARE-associated domain
MTDTLPWPAQQIAEWMPLWQGMGFFLATFVLEDLAAIGAGLLLAAGAISWPVALASCFLGIWSGDTGLYALARFGGRTWFERSRLRRFSKQVADSERWFAERGSLILIFSRCIPGARLPTYLASGFLRLPLQRFLLVTGTASLIWTLLVLWLVQIAGTRLVDLFGAYRHGSYLLFATGLGLVITLQLLRRAFRNFELRKMVPQIERWLHWEFWPGWLFYPPVGIYCAWLALKYRGLAVATAANPGIFSGGIVGESKIGILNELSATSPEFTAKAGLVSGDTFESRLRSFDEIRIRLCLSFPLVLKPDVGQRGIGIKLIRTREQAENYLRQTSTPLVVQHYAPEPCEAGIFYYRFPHERHGRIFAITEKLFPIIIGDGQSTIEDLIWRDMRAKLIANTYLSRFALRRTEVLPAGEKLKLVESGNHAQGCIFLDGMHLNSPALEKRIDAISQKLNGFFVGRYDIRYANEQDLRAGINFQIIELNGAASEATSIYDPRNSLQTAYRTLFRQWDLVFAIGAENRRLGAVPTKFLPVWKKWRAYSKTAQTYPRAD